MTSLLAEELDYYRANQEDFVKKYNDKILVIKKQRILGVYDDKLSAITETEKTEQPGTFMVIRCTPGDGEYTRRFRSRVYYGQVSA